MQMKKEGINKSNFFENYHKTTLFWINIGILASFFFIFSFQKGLFFGGQFNFERPLLYFYLLGSIVLFLLSIQLFSNWKFSSVKDLLSIIIWIFPLIYFINLLRSPSYYLASNTLYLYIVYASIFTFGAFSAVNQVGKKMIYYLLILSGYLIIIFGVLNWLGFFHYSDAILGEGTGVRLSSIFQYPPTYSAYLVAMFFCSLITIVFTNKWASIVLSSFMLFPISLSLFLTYSGGGYLLLPVLLIIVLLFLPFKKQLLFIFYFVTSIILSYSVSDIFKNYGIHAKEGITSIAGLLLFLAFSSILVLIVLIERKFLGNLIDKFHENKNKLIIPTVTLLLFIIGGLILFSQISNVSKNTSHSLISNMASKQADVVSRFIFYKDSITILKKSPLIGAGGGAWKALYNKYKSGPYASNQTHNYYLQYLLEVGIVGFILLILFFFIIYFLFIKNYSKQTNNEKYTSLIFFIISITILIHCLVDFDMSFAFISSVVYLCLGGLASTAISPINLRIKISTHWNKLYGFAIAITSLILFITSIPLLKSNYLYEEALNILNTTQSYNDIIKPLNASIDLQPYNPEYVTTKAQLLAQVYNQTKDQKFLDQFENLVNTTSSQDVTNRRLIDIKYVLYMSKGDYEKALEFVQKGTQDYPWDIDLYEKYMYTNFLLGEKARNDQNFELMNSYWGHVTKTFSDLTAKREILSRSLSKGFQFNLTPNMFLYTGQINFIKGNYQEASNLLEIGVKLDEANLNKPIARWYLASLIKLGRTDQKLYNKLMQLDKNEEQEINKLLQIKFTN